MYEVYYVVYMHVLGLGLSLILSYTLIGSIVRSSIGSYTVYHLFIRSSRCLAALGAAATGQAHPGGRAVAIVH